MAAASSGPTPCFRIGIDTGGTFTDIVAVDVASGAMRVTKVTSTPSNPAIGLVRGVHRILDDMGAGVADVAGLSPRPPGPPQPPLSNPNHRAVPDLYGGF